MLKKNIILTIVLLASSALTVASLSVSPEEPEKIEKEIVYLRVSWYREYSLLNLTRITPLIVIADVTKIVNKKESSVPGTDYEIKVLKYIKNNESITDRTLIVGMMGVETETHIFVIKTNPLLKVGERNVFFLYGGSRKDGTSTGKYGFPGPWGRYVIKNDRVNSLDVLYPELFGGFPLSSRVKDKALKEYIKTIEKNMKKETTE